jgi:hypothetical protein
VHKAGAEMTLLDFKPSDDAYDALRTFHAHQVAAGIDLEERVSCPDADVVHDDRERFAAPCEFGFGLGIVQATSSQFILMETSRFDCPLPAPLPRHPLLSL